MSGAPTQNEIISQWKSVVDILEDSRVFIDGTLAGGGGLWDVAETSLEGEYTPQLISAATAAHRRLASAMVSPDMAAQFLTPILAEWSRIINTNGVPYTSTTALMRALWEHFRTTSASINSRGITYDTSATAGGSNVGNGAVSRLTVDEGGYNLEACHVEQKVLRCRTDQRSGGRRWAEEFEVVTQPKPQDALLRASTAYGSGESSARRLYATHAGTGNGGSLLRNSSFSTYSASGTPKFSGWTETAGGANLSQVTATYYRSYPGATVDASLKMDGTAAATMTITQTLSDMVRGRFDVDRPYLLRAMVNKTTGTADGGNFVLKLGGQTLTTSMASVGANWQEILMPVGANSWFRNFNTTDMSVVVEWATPTSGYLLVDDLILVPMDEIDGTFWNVRHNGASPVPWKVDDTLTFTDTSSESGGTIAKLQWWLWVAGLGYLPSNNAGAETITDP